MTGYPYPGAGTHPVSRRKPTRNVRRQLAQPVQKPNPQKTQKPHQKTKSGLLCHVISSEKNALVNKKAQPCTELSPRVSSARWASAYSETWPIRGLPGERGRAWASLGFVLSGCPARCSRRVWRESLSVIWSRRREESLGIVLA